MPTKIHERLWEEPGPAQDGESAPKLLILYPEEEMEPHWAGVMRYAGRVEPEDVAVTLNGEKLKVWPGGVFTGLHSIPAGKVDKWRFRATAKGETTTVTREVRRKDPPEPPPPWPLAFDANPVQPTGDYLLPEGEKLKVTLFASVGHRAYARIGEDGDWQSMQAEDSDPSEGGRYMLEVTPPPIRDGLHPIHFRLKGEMDGLKQTKEMKSVLRVGARPKGMLYGGRINHYLATFLKNASSSDWERWGNWPEGTLFPIVEMRGERVRADFGRGETGWIGIEHADIDWKVPYCPIPIPEPELNALGNGRIRLESPTQAVPIACVFHHVPEPDGDRLRISLPGVAAVRADKTYDVKTSRGFEALRLLRGGGGVPVIESQLSEPLWGFAMLSGPAMGIELRVRPDLKEATDEEPLKGLRVMVDAGHGGGESLGALGPSGLTEADANLVQAAWLERHLLAHGAEVRQTRRDHSDVDLDERCKLADQWDPDLFISLHHNSVGFIASPLADRGPKLFYHYEHSRPLAEAVAAALTEEMTPGEKPRVIAKNFRVNRNISLCPSILVETAFVCHPEDEYLLRQTSTHQRSARAIAEAVVEYVRGK